MITRLTILGCVIALHLLTPRFFFSDVLRIFEWIMIGGMVVAILIYYFKQNDKRIKSLSLVLSINSALYFLITAGEYVPDIGDPRMFYRLKIIAGIKSGLADNLGYAIEYFNYIQVLLTIIIMGIIIVLLFIREKQPAKTGR